MEVYYYLQRLVVVQKPKINTFLQKTHTPEHTVDLYPSYPPHLESPASASGPDPAPAMMESNHVFESRRGTTTKGFMLLFATNFSVDWMTLSATCCCSSATPDSRTA